MTNYFGKPGNAGIEVTAEEFVNLKLTAYQDEPLDEAAEQGNKARAGLARLVQILFEKGILTESDIEKIANSKLIS